MTVIEFLDWLAAVARKIEQVVPVLGYLVGAILGGCTAFVKEWEDRNPQRTVSQHVWALVRRMFFAFVAGWLWYQIVVWQNLIGSPLSYLGATLVGLYATEFLDFIWGQMKTRLGAAQPPKTP